MIDPLTEANEEAAKGNDRGWNHGECVEQASARKQEDCNAHNHEHLVPVVERKLGERIIHWLLGSSVNMHNAPVHARRLQPVVGRQPTTPALHPRPTQAARFH